MTGRPQVPPYIGRVLGPGGSAVGTCFGINENTLVTACHVLDQLASKVGSKVQVDGLDRPGEQFTVRVLAMDPSSDVAVMQSSAGLPTAVSAILLTDTVPPFTRVLITGVADIEDSHDYHLINSTGEWQGNARRDGLDLGRLQSKAVVPGMSGAPVRRASDGAVIGLVSARYNSRDSWMRDSVWVARTEHILDLIRTVVPAAELLSLDVREDSSAQSPGGPPPGPAGWAALRAPTGRLPEHVRGRDELLMRLEALLEQSDGRIHVLAGLGGTGKSTIALWLAEKAAEREIPAWWVPAADAEAVTGKLLELAGEIGATSGEIAQAQARQRSPADLLWRYLRRHPAWLLIFDNADDPGVLAIGDADAASGAGWLRPTTSATPGTRGRIIVTSRVRDAQTWGRHAEVHPVGWLDPVTGGQVLTDLASHAGSAAEAEALSDRLGGLPLALHHAGSQLASEFATEPKFAGYTRALDERFERLMGGGQGAAPGGRDDRAIVTGTWELSLDALAARGRPEARPLLRVLCCLAPAIVIPNAMLDRAVLSQVCEDDQDRVADGLRALSSVGLIMTGQEPAGSTVGVTVHPLVSETSRLRLDAEHPGRPGGVAVGLLDAFTHDLDVARSTDWPAWAQLVPHLNALYDHVAAGLADPDLVMLADVTEQAAMAFYMSGAYATSGDLARAALRYSGRLGADHRVALKLRSRIASAHRFLGRSDIAEPEYRELLDDETRILGPDHPDTLATRHEIANTLARQGRQEQAQREYREVLDRRTGVLGPDHPDTLATRYESARTLAEQGQHEQAERELRDILDRRTRVLGPEHQGTLTTRHEIAYTLAARGHYGQAERELRYVLDAWPRVLGADHPDTLDTWQLLACTVALQGRRDQAQQEFRGLLEARTRTQGPEHPSTREAQRWLDNLAG